MANGLGEALRRERRRRGETQAQAARRFGVSQPAVHRWETGEHTPADGQFPLLARYLGVRAEDVWRMLNERPDETELAAAWRRIAILEAELGLLRDEVDVLQD